MSLINSNRISITSIFVCLALTLSGCAQEGSKASKPVDTPSIPDEELITEPIVVSLSKEKLDKLLDKRVGFKLKSPFIRLANAILVQSADHFDYCIYPVSSNKKVNYHPLIDTNPSFYKPTLRQYFDTIAIQTGTRWKYSNDESLLTDETKKLPIKKDVVAFTFEKHKRVMPFSVDLARGWKNKDMGLMMKITPPECPIGLDIFELGTFTSDSSDNSFYDKIAKDIALTWAKRVTRSSELTESVLSESEVAKHKAYYFEKTIPTKIGYPAKWRQWVFFVDSRCFMAVATIFPKYESKYYPQVLKMLESFQVNKGQ